MKTHCVKKRVLRGGMLTFRLTRGERLQAGVNRRQSRDSTPNSSHTDSAR